MARDRGCAPVDAFCDAVLADDLAGQWGALVMNADEAAMEPMLRHPAAVVALSDAGAHLDTLCDQGFTTYLLGHWARERGRLGLEEAVRLVTAVPAERYGLHGRGRIAPGLAGDLVLFDPERVGTLPTELVHDLPEGQPRLLQRAVGVEWVFVGGEPVVERGRSTGRRPGRVLRGGR
jgi:N-acyl-D-aspartate/D-glutamate deacylase